MDLEHTHSLTADYALGLLPAEERRRVESHARQCDECRMALQRDQAIEAMVRGTVQQVARPAAGRLAALRPSPPLSRRYATPLYRRLAPVTLVAVMLFMGLVLASGYMPLTPALYATSSSSSSTPPASPWWKATA